MPDCLYDKCLVIQWPFSISASLKMETFVHIPPYTSEVEARSRRAPTRLANPVNREKHEQISI